MAGAGRRPWEYKEITVKGAKSPRPNGTVLEHRHVAAISIGRELRAEEVVHHKDEDRGNNKPDNLMVFSTLSDHSRFHKTGVAIPTGDGAFYSPPVNLKKPCAECGTVLTYATYCSACSHARQRKVARPDKESLQRLIATKSWSAIGREFGVSDNAIRKWAKDYGLTWERSVSGSTSDSRPEGRRSNRRVPATKPASNVKKEGPPGTVWCARHEAFLPVNAFSKNKATWSGYETYCKECRGSRRSPNRRRLTQSKA